MSEKEHISATVDPEVAAYLSQNTVNTSGLINRLVKQYMTGSDTSREMLQLRQNQLESQLSQLTSQQDSVVKELEQVEKELQKLDQQEETELQESLEVLASVPWEIDNPAIQQHAVDLDMDPEDLIAHLEDYHA